MHEPFWMIYGFGCGAPTMMHESYETAAREAARLARVSPGTKFYILRSVACAVKTDVELRKIEYHRVEDDQIPF